MKNILAEHRSFWNSENRRSFSVGVFLLALAVFIQIRTGRYAAKSATNFVGDLFLDNLPVVHLDFLIVAGAVLFFLSSSVVLLLKPRYLLFGMKAAAIFMATRALFISLTHIGIYPEQIVLDDNDFLYGIYQMFDFQGNFFFSGHTGFPYLLALVFWRDKTWRYVFLLISVVFGAGVLLAHVHYSIDVFAAPFIAYGIFSLTKKLFRKDYLVLQGNAA